MSEKVMSQENVETIRRTLEAFNRADKAAWLADHDPDVVMIPARQWPENAPVRGADAVWDFYLAATDTWDEGSTQIGEVIGSGDTLVVNNRRDARGRASGANVEFSYWTVVTFRSGKPARYEWFADRAEAVEAAGLSE
jgi:ketosteroid isomerase-like protein